MKTRQTFRLQQLADMKWGFLASTPRSEGIFGDFGFRGRATQLPNTHS